MDKRAYGSGRVMYWAHAVGPTERRGSVRSAEAAFELVPLTTKTTPYENVLLVDVGTHPRLIPAETLRSMLPPGIHLTELARRSMPALAEESLTTSTASTGETIWTIADTATAFQEYWNDQDPYDMSPSSLEDVHVQIAELARDIGHMPIKTFPVPTETILLLIAGRINTLDDLFGIGVADLKAMSGTTSMQIAEMFRIIGKTLAARTIEHAPRVVHDEMQDA